MSVRMLFASLLAVGLVAQAPPPPPPQGGPGAKAPMAPMAPMGRMAMRGQGGMGPGMGAGHRAAMGAEFLARHLKLSEAQIARIKEIRTKGHEAAQAKQEARKAVQLAAAKPDATASQLKGLFQAAADKRFEVMAERLATRQAVRGVLTPEQRTEADRLQALAQERRQFMQEKMQQHMKQGGQGMGRGMMGGPGGRPGMGHPGMGPGGMPGPGGRGWGDGSF